MTMAADGTRLSIDDPEAQKARRGMIELVMTKPPPRLSRSATRVASATSRIYSDDRPRLPRFRFKKRTHRDQYLAPFVNCEMNRCIQCYPAAFVSTATPPRGETSTCWAGTNHVYFGRHRDGSFKVPSAATSWRRCPTGVFTDKTFKDHYTRNGTCRPRRPVCVALRDRLQHTIPGERYGMLHRANP